MPLSSGNSHTSKLRQNDAPIIAALAEHWPCAFSVYQAKRKPLKRGVDQDIIAAAADIFTLSELKSALRFYCGNLDYLRACREGAERVGLSGEPAGTVTADEAARAARIIERRRQNKAAKLIAATPVTIAPLPKPAPPQRLGLADLKRAALQRKAAAAS
jgi:sRNA-binding protein